MQQIIEQEKARLKQLNKPASKMLFNPARTSSHIDFVADAKAGPDLAKPYRMKNARPRTSMGDCMTHLTQTEPDKEKKAYKVT